ncbi:MULTISPECIES: 4-aminobutyrate--2-oxoglutarate transaminase [Prauserella salsuginis group]|uniref:(S)-3-amino-2-methylpropionate transaminase n=1 Tax=Prauserella salsuginis TaxID=387889 RepID=A0ABW6G0Q2_9PSEU|nr:MULTISPECIES: 4-aminobutyrate--2-oxoglutarate transaminase [Prauserella salsuginis group]MCR3721941.1 4-aminobutyrate aminotransferase / (S)-3-amino-2-methylpropionate transaminase [Prauserella flava]MCR3735947.1 4-aminobutyrate aminotransferase / (S)-3-amino-2-methylpropionate transaminase [Prauserella salsuginis]
MPQPEQRRILATAIPGPKSLKLHEHRGGEVAGGLGSVLPVFVDSAGGGVLVDVDGNHLIDLASGIAVTSVGASHPHVVQELSEQAQRFTHSCFLVTEYEGFVDVAAALNRITPGDHAKKTALFSTGAEAVENAVKIARTATGRSAVVTLGHGYHGRTLLTMSMTAKNAPYKEGFGPFAPEVYRVPSPYPYRWPSGSERSGEEALAALRELVLTQVGSHNVAAIVAEPIQGEGGFVVPPPGYLKAVQEFAHEHGIVFVADEIQTGLARTGDMFACEHEDVVPDMITTAKALAGGMPLAAVTGRAELMDSVPAGGLGGTYAGNPVACAAALATLEIIERERLVERAREIEQRVIPRLEALTGPGSVVGEVRGRGAMLAVEFVNPGTTEPADDIARAVAAHCHRQGVLVLVCGTYGNVIRLLPPLVIGMDLLDEGIDVLEEAVRSVR